MFFFFSLKESQLDPVFNIYAAYFDKAKMQLDHNHLPSFYFLNFGTSTNCTNRGHGVIPPK